MQVSACGQFYVQFFLQPLFYGFSQTLVAMETFGAVTGLVTNFDKSSAHPIRCEDLDLQHILEPFQGARKDFPSAILAFSCLPTKVGNGEFPVGGRLPIPVPAGDKVHPSPSP